MEGIGGVEEAHIDAGHVHSLLLESSSSAEYLPDELLQNILSRLPVKSLIRFTCVCKSWLRLIRSPEFAHYHYATRCSLLGNAFDYLLAVKGICCTKFTSFYFISYDTLNIDVNDPFSLPIFELKLLPPPENRRYRYYTCQIVGPCYGIFCLKICIDSRWYPSILLWNPATREVRALTGGPSDFDQLGLGFDSLTGDFKVVCTHHHLDENNYHLVEVYSLNSDSWRTLDASYFFDQSWGFCEFVFSDCCNGRMFNWSSRVCADLLQFLVSFDMTDEVFMRTSFPGKYLSYHLTGQQSNESQVNIFCYRWDSRNIADFWVLDSNYGPCASWTMLRTVTLPCDNIELLGFWKDELLLENGKSTLVSYDPNLKHFRSTGIKGDHAGVGYTSSLVPLKSRGVEEHERVRLSMVRRYNQTQGNVDEREQASLLEIPIEICHILPNSHDHIAFGEGDGDDFNDCYIGYTDDSDGYGDGDDGGNADDE